MNKMKGSFILRDCAGITTNIFNDIVRELRALDIIVKKSVTLHNFVKRGMLLIEDEAWIPDTYREAKLAQKSDKYKPIKYSDLL